MADGRSDEQDKQRIVRQYVERQRAYLPTYTAEHLLDAPLGTPSKQPPHGDEFGFDTPVLRPRVPVKEGAQSPLALRAGPNKRAREARRGRHEEVPSIPETRDPALNKIEKTRAKRRKASTPIDTDDENERTARLADRRERKREKRAIVNAPEQQDPTPKKARSSNQKVKRSTALALLYGFSATNVTKDRLTVKPAPCLGVFSKGRASAKKKVTAAARSSSRNELFSESKFLNKPSERASDHSKVEDNSSISSQLVSDEICSTKRARKDKGKCIRATNSNAPRASTRAAAESEVWDIEMQSKLPSSAADVSSELEEKDSAPVVINIRGAEWSASLDVAGQEEEGLRKKTSCPSITRSLPGGRFTVRNPSLAGSDQHDETRLVQAADAPSIHPSHSASQVGRRIADHQPPDQHLVASKYFSKPNPAAAQESNANHPQSSRSHDDTQELAANSPPPLGSLPSQQPGTPACFTELESALAGKHPQSLGSNDDMDVPCRPIPDRTFSRTTPTIYRVASPIDSLMSVPQQVTFQTSYDTTLDPPSDSTPDDDYGGVDVSWREPSVGPSDGYVQRSAQWYDVTASEQAVEYPHYGSDTWDCYQTLSGTAPYDVELVGTYDDPLAPEFQEDPSAPRFFEAPAEDDPRNPGRWLYMDEASHNSTMYDDEYSKEDLRDNAADFLEGRALLLRVADEHEEPCCTGLSGLAQAEMDVASRLRDHWRPLRL